MSIMAHPITLKNNIYIYTLKFKNSALPSQISFIYTANTP